MNNTDIIKIDIELHWSQWTNMGQINLNSPIPKCAGVYQIQDIYGKMQTIGKSNNLHRRIAVQFCTTTGKHSTRSRIHSHGITNDSLEVRWAIVTQCSAAEEELLHRYKEQYGDHPKFCKQSY